MEEPYHLWATEPFSRRLLPATYPGRDRYLDHKGHYCIVLIANKKP
jgi:hypothetical protein